MTTITKKLVQKIMSSVRNRIVHLFWNMIREYIHVVKYNTFILPLLSDSLALYFYVPTQAIVK